MYVCMYVFIYITTDGRAQKGWEVAASRIGKLHALPSAHELEHLDEIKVVGLF
jgi:hypothetical protein